MLALKNLTLNFKNTPAIKNINLEIAQGQTCAIIGPSGCGKTTTLNILANNITNHTGEVLFNGLPLNHATQAVGFISQSYGLLPWKNVYKNIILPLKIRHMPIDAQAIASLMAELSIDDIAKRYPNNLSGGQKQRVAIGAAFAMAPQLLLMDEPFSALDQITREDVQDLFFKMWGKYRPTTLLVTHSISEAVMLGQKIAIYSKAPGEIIRIIDNPTLGEKDSRSSPMFHKISTEIRQLIREEWGH